MDKAPNEPSHSQPLRKRHANVGSKSAQSARTAGGSSCPKRLRHYEALTSWRREFCGVCQVWCGADYPCRTRRGIIRSRPYRQKPVSSHDECWLGSASGWAGACLLHPGSCVVPVDCSALRLAATNYHRGCLTRLSRPTVVLDRFGYGTITYWTPIVSTAGTAILDPSIRH